MYTIEVVEVPSEPESVRKNCTLPIKSKQEADKLLETLMVTKGKLDDCVILSRIIAIMLAIFGIWACCVGHDIGESLHKSGANSSVRK